MSERIYNALTGTEVQKIAEAHLEKVGSALRSQRSLGAHLSWPRVAIKVTLSITSPDVQTQIHLVSSTEEVLTPDTARETHDLEIPIAVEVPGGKREKRIKQQNLIKESDEQSE